MMFPLLRLARHIPRAPLRPFTTTAALPKNKPSKQNLPARPTPPPEDDIEEAFVKGSGPGGQKIVSYRPIPHLLNPVVPSLGLHQHPSPRYQHNPPPPVLRPKYRNANNPPRKEQDKLRRPTKTPPNWHSSKVPSHALPLPEPHHSPEPPRGAPRRAAQR